MNTRSNRLPARTPRLTSWTALPVAVVTLAMAHCGLAEPLLVTADQTDGQLIFRADGQEMFRYFAGPGELPRDDIKPVYLRGGYISKVFTPSGRLVTDDYPTNHLHQHGIWNPWTKTEFEGRTPDFWNMGKGTARVDFVKLVRVWQDGPAAGFVAKHKFVDLLANPPRTVLNETWEVRATAEDGAQPRYLIDITSTQTCATDSPLKLPEYRYGGMGFRGHEYWNGPDNCLFLTSNGETDRLKAHATRSKWCWVGGELDGRIVGVTILCHPDNFRFPQPMRVHPTEPFFCYAPQQLGDMEITPGQPYISKYRFVIRDGRPSMEEANAWWKQFTGEADPVRAR